MNLRHLLRRHNNPLSTIIRLTTTSITTYTPTPTHTLIFPNPSHNHTFLKPFHTSLPLSSTSTAIAFASEDENDGAMNEFLSRFVHSMRSVLTNAYPLSDKPTIDAMLAFVVQKLVSRMENNPETFDANYSDVAENDDLTKTMLDVSNTVFLEMEREKKKTKLGKFLQCDEVKTLARFASEVGIRGDMLRELRFKWAREAMENAQVYAELKHLKDAEHEHEQENGQEHEQDGVVDEQGLPKRKGKIDYKLYGLDLSGDQWREVAEKVHETEVVVWPAEAKEITDKCRLVTDKIVGLKMDEEEGYVTELLKEWVEMLEPTKVDWFALLDNVKKRDFSVYLKMAERVLDEPTFQPDIRDYSQLIDIRAKDNRTEDVERLLKKMNGKGFLPDVLTLTTLLHLYSKSNNLDQAKEAYEALINQGFRPDKQIYDSMIKAYINAGKAKAADALMREMYHKGIKLSEEICMSLLQAFSQRGDMEGAQQTVNTMHFAGFQPTPESCTLLMQASAKSGNPTEARNTFEYMMRLGFKPDDRSTSILISAYERKNELDKALSLLLRLEKDGFEPGVSTYCVLVDWLGKLQLIDEAEQVLAKIAQLGEAPPFKIQVGLFDMYFRAATKAKNDLEYEKKAPQAPEVLEAKKVLPVYEKKALQTLGVLEAKNDLLEHEDFERIIKSLLKGGFMNDADRIQKLMEARGFTPSDSLGVSKLTIEAFRRSGTSNRPGMR